MLSFSIWDCPESPNKHCVYCEELDSNRQHCIFCGYSEKPSALKYKPNQPIAILNQELKQLALNNKECAKQIREKLSEETLHSLFL